MVSGSFFFGGGGGWGDFATCTVRAALLRDGFCVLLHEKWIV